MFIFYPYIIIASRTPKSRFLSFDFEYEKQINRLNDYIEKTEQLEDNSSKKKDLIDRMIRFKNNMNERVDRHKYNTIFELNSFFHIEDIHKLKYSQCYIDICDDHDLIINKMCEAIEQFKNKYFSFIYQPW